MRHDLVVPCHDRLLVGIDAQAAVRPNVLFVVVDDLRPGFGAYGCYYIQRPRPDRLAKSGVAFNRAYPPHHPTPRGLAFRWVPMIPLTGRVPTRCALHTRVVSHTVRRCA